MFHSGSRDSRGFTLVEVSIIVMALAILSAILLPQIGVFLRDARFARAREDVAAIGVAMMQWLKDTGESSFYASPQGNWRSPRRFQESDGEPVGLLIGDGDTPDGLDRASSFGTFNVLPVPITMSAFSTDNSSPALIVLPADTSSTDDVFLTENR